MDRPGGAMFREIHRPWPPPALRRADQLYRLDLVTDHTGTTVTDRAHHAEECGQLDVTGAWNLHDTATLRRRAAPFIAPAERLHEAWA